MRLGIRAAVLLLPAVTSLAAQQEGPLRHRLDAATYAALQPILDAARRDSVPLTALETRALLGASRRRPGSEIVESVRNLADQLRAARRVLRQAAPAAPLSDGEVFAAAEALRRGVPAEDLARIRERAPERRTLEIPFAVLGELVGRGVPAGDARAVIEHLVVSDVPAERLVEIPARVDIALRVGAPPVAALTSALQRLGLPAPPGPPERPGPRRPIPDVPGG
jgi:hypothetical protein